MPNQLDKEHEITLTDITPVPLKWIYGLCSIVITLAIIFASHVVSDMRDEIKVMSKNVAQLNTTVAVVITDQTYAKKAIERSDLKIEDLQKRVSGLEQRKR